MYRKIVDDRGRQGLKISKKSGSTLSTKFATPVIMRDLYFEVRAPTMIFFDPASDAIRS